MPPDFTKHASREDWLRARRPTIGGSEIATILGRNPYSTPAEAWARKHGIIPPLQQTENMEWGNRLERPIIEAYCDRMDVPVAEVVVGEHLLARPVGPDSEWASATPDALLPDRGLECKAIGERAYKDSGDWGEPGTDTVPVMYAMQCQWCMWICDRQRWDLAVLVGGQSLYIYHLHRSEKLIAVMRARGRRWWERHIRDNEAPEATTPGDVRTIHPGPDRSDKDLLPAPPSLDETALEYAAAKADLAAAKARADALEARLGSVIGDAYGLEGRGWTAKYPKIPARVAWGEVAKEIRARFLASATPEQAEQFDREWHASIAMHTGSPFRRMYFKADQQED